MSKHMRALSCAMDDIAQHGSCQRDLFTASRGDIWLLSISWLNFYRISNQNQFTKNGQWSGSSPDDHVNSYSIDMIYWWRTSRNCIHIVHACWDVMPAPWTQYVPATIVRPQAEPRKASVWRKDRHWPPWQSSSYVSILLAILWQTSLIRCRYSQ